MDLNAIRSVYFLGIGGIGMSALARFFALRGARVAGYDRSSSPLTDQLIAEGMQISFDEHVAAIPKQVDLVVYTPAVPPDHKAFAHFEKKGIPVIKRAAVLGDLSRQFKTIAVAGTHGKTTTSTMITHILHAAKIDHLSFLGGISKNYGSNLLYTKAAVAPQTTTPGKTPGQSFHQPVYCVVEADEYDRSFLQLDPYIAIITSADADHLDIYGNHEDLKKTFAEFTGKIIRDGSLVMKAGTAVEPVRNNVFYEYSYALNSEATFFARNIRLRDELLHFDYVTPTETISNLTLGVPGMFNLENAVAALAVGYLLGVDKAHLIKALRSYQGVQRRFDFRIRRKDLVYIDDYAHHPEELRACITAARDLYPGKKLTGIFQPHLFSRTRDLADDFAKSLSLLDALILLDIYPAREKPIKGVTSKLLLDKVTLKDKQLLPRDMIAGELLKNKPEVLLTLGAGDIDQLVKPITDTLSGE
jgi:UDP-N-acetylmuramate--alanine ligase